MDGRQTPAFDDEALLRVFATLNERQARLYAAERALALGQGGRARIARLTGLSYPTLRQGVAELRGEVAPAAALAPGRVRRPGGGRKKVAAVDPALGPRRREVVEASTAGRPADARRWLSTSKARVAAALAARGHLVAPNTVGRRLRNPGYSLQANRKGQEGFAPPERDAQFRYLNDPARAFLARGQPHPEGTRSVDTTQKELVGDFKHGGRTWRPQGEPVRVKVHACPSPSRGKAVPYGVYDLGQHRGFVNVGPSHDTPDCAVQSIRLWWEHEGRDRSATADSPLIFADSGGRNSARSRLWKPRLQELADALAFPITVGHLPPGTSSQWNKIEHRLCSSISLPWRGRPLADDETVVSLIGATTTTAGLIVSARLDVDAYPTGVTVPDAVRAQLALRPHATHPQWNYTLVPRTAPS